MSKDTINIDGKTYVRQDSPAVNPRDITNAKNQLSRIKKLSFLGSFIFGCFLALIGFSIVFSAAIVFISFVISIIISSKSIEKNFSSDVIQAAFPEKNYSQDNPFSYCSSNYLRYRND